MFTKELNAVFEPNDYFYFYKDILTPKRTKTELSFIIKKLTSNRPLKILDLACGYGRHAAPLAAKGHQVVGVDISKAFLKVARSQAKKKSQKINYLHGDMRKISFTNKFDIALLLFTSFGYFNGADNFRVLKNVSRALKPGGLFCFDTVNLSIYKKDFEPIHVQKKGENRMIDRITFDKASGRVYNRRIVIRDRKRKDKPFSLRLYSAAEIRKLLAKAGLSLQNLYGNWDSSRLTVHSGRMIVIAKK